jgi:hypothetical protein
MKKRVFILMAGLIAAMTFSSCSEQETVDDGLSASGKPVSFGTFVGKSASRAPDLKLAGLQTSGFIVQAYNTDNLTWAEFTPSATPNFMSNQKVTYSSAWTYEPAKYWPANSGKVTFFAYGASGATDGIPTGLTNPTGQTDQAAAPKFDFTVQDAASSQVDLVADALFDQMYASNSGKVNFAFDHILSKIAFSAKTAADYSSDATVTVTVTDLQLTFGGTAIQTNGTFTFDGTAATLGAWALASSDHAYIPTTKQDLYTGSGVALNTTAAEINDNTQYLMVIPQTVTADVLTAYITYTITAASTPTTYNVVKTLPAVTLALGKQYTFNFTITLNAVVFEGITVADWVADETQPADTAI